METTAASMVDQGSTHAVAETSTISSSTGNGHAAERATPSASDGESAPCSSSDAPDEPGGETKEEQPEFIVGKVVLGPPDFVRKIEMFRNQGRSRLGKDHLMRHCAQDPAACAEADGIGADGMEDEGGPTAAEQVGGVAEEQGTALEEGEQHHKPDASLARASDELKGLAVGGKADAPTTA